MTKEQAKVKVYDLSIGIEQAQAQIRELNKFIFQPEEQSKDEKNVDKKQ